MSEVIRKLKFIVDEDLLVKDFIKQKISRNFYKYSKNIQAVYYRNNEIVKTYMELDKGDEFRIEYHLFEEKENHFKIDKEIEILYEDDYYIIANKEAGLLSIPSSKELDSVFGRLLNHLKNTPYFPHILNRLDKDTRGLILVSKCSLSASLINDVKKRYWALTRFPLHDEEGVIDKPIKKSAYSIKREISPLGKKARTHYQLIEEKNGIYRYDVTLENGRTHQIRLHFSSEGSPLISDPLYGQKEEGQNLGLICYKISFIHPFTNELIGIEIGILD